ncbi:hypothetical protein PQI07_26660 [Methylobacterium sp. 092160098-2]|jgi:hypothetical protein|uniref:hypothetical protein n=1 Tax=Methylobacterium sp. 092160098-2 TaxID=3025129 RepID=UPI002381BA13|nr:hypothetical protein [Methylobacterium sp. 092160098-2]MDE4914257.1 hypothetical protein [Methylobacterium sp. 092160098-2]
MATTYPAEPIAVSVRRLASRAVGRDEGLLDDGQMLDLARSAIGIPVLWATMLGAFGFGFHGGPLLPAVVGTASVALFVCVLQTMTVPLMILPSRVLRALGYAEADGLAEAVLVLAAGGGLVAVNAAFAYPFSREFLLALGAASVIYGFGVSLARLPDLRLREPIAPQLVRLVIPFLPGPIWFVATAIVLDVAERFSLGRRLADLATAILA